MEIYHMIWHAFRYGAFELVKGGLAINLCNIQSYVLIPICFSKNKDIKNACMGFVMCLGILAAIMGMWANSSLFNDHPIWTSEIIYTTLIHCIPGMLSIFFPVSNLYRLQFKKVWITLCTIIPFEIVSLILDYTLSVNYMFLRNPAGTPFKLFYDLSNGNLGLYSFLVIVGMNAYVVSFYGIWHLISKLIIKCKNKKDIKLA